MRSSTVALLSGPSGTSAFSTATQGIRPRSEASASRARVISFSLTRSFSRAVSHSCGDTIGGVFMACSPVFAPPVDASVLLAGDGADGWDDLVPAVAHVLERQFVPRQHEAGV